MGQPFFFASASLAAAAFRAWSSVTLGPYWGIGGCCAKAGVAPSRSAAATTSLLLFMGVSPGVLLGAGACAHPTMLTAAMTGDSYQSAPTRRDRDPCDR